MHTFSAGKIQYHYNPDLSGDVIIQHPAGSLMIKGEDFLKFIAEIIRNRRMYDLEDMEPHEILGFKKEC